MSESCCRRERTVLGIYFRWMPVCPSPVANWARLVHSLGVMPQVFSASLVMANALERVTVRSMLLTPWRLSIYEILFVVVSATINVQWEPTHMGNIILWYRFMLETSLVVKSCNGISLHSLSHILAKSPAGKYRFSSYSCCNMLPYALMTASSSHCVYCNDL